MTSDFTSQLVDESQLTKLLVHTGNPGFGVSFGESIVLGDVTVAATRPNERLLIGPTESVRRVAVSIASENVNSVDVTHGQAMLRLTGKRSASLLEYLCDLDFSDRMTPNGAVVSGYVARVVCDLLRQDQGDVASFRLVFDRSYGPYLAGVIRELLHEQRDDAGLRNTDGVGSR